MVEHESHLISVAVDGSNAMDEGAHQIVDPGEQHIGQCSSLQVAPQPLDEIQIGTVRRQPVDFDPMPMTVQPILHGSGMVISGVVADQPNLASPIGPQERGQKSDEVQPALGIRHDGGDLSRGVVHRAIHSLLLVLSRGWNARLTTDPRPHPRQERVQVDFGFVLKEQRFGCVLAQRFFLRACSSVLALAWAFSSRFPWRVCLGRCRENCS